MKEDKFDQSVRIAFSELPWLLLLGVVLLGCYNMIKHNKMIAQKDKQIVEDTQKIEELESQARMYTAMMGRFKAMQKELDRFKLVEKENTAIMGSLNAMQNELDCLKLIEKEYKEIVEKFPDDNSLKDSALLGIKQEKIIELQKQNSQLRKELAITRKGDTLIRKELLGLKGPLQNVAFILDKSYSMKKGQRWDKTCDIVKTWLTYLNIDKCVLVQFNDGIKVILDDKTKTDPYLEMVGEKRQANLEELLVQLKKVKPSGRTNTYKAIKKAMEYKPDTIILFTDGAPVSTFHFGKYDEKQMNAILKEFSKEHVPINIVALGDYFDQRLCQFLRELADSTGGSFIGK